MAERHLDRLYGYVASRSGENTADRYIGRILDHCQGLIIFPKRGTRRDDLLPGLRTIGFERRVTIAFVVEKDRVLIEGIFYGGQNFEAAFGGDE
jgi:toxin ParE1/3/4